MDKFLLFEDLSRSLVHVSIFVVGWASLQRISASLILYEDVCVCGCVSVCVSVCLCVHVDGCVFLSGRLLQLRDVLFIIHVCCIYVSVWWTRSNVWK